MAVFGLLSDTHYPERLAQLPPALFTVLSGVNLLLHRWPIAAGRVSKATLLAPIS
jgi:hypothetical protein